MTQSIELLVGALYKRGENFSISLNNLIFKPELSSYN